MVAGKFFPTELRIMGIIQVVIVWQVLTIEERSKRFKVEIGWFLVKVKVGLVYLKNLNQLWNQADLLATKVTVILVARVVGWILAIWTEVRRGIFVSSSLMNSKA